MLQIQQAIFGHPSKYSLLLNFSDGMGNVIW